MATPTFIRRELMATKLYFIPSGETVDAVTVAQETWPDEDPTTNFTDYEMPDIERLVSEKEIQTEDRLVPSASGGYVNDPEEMVTMRKFLGTTAKTNNFLKQLDFGLANPIADATSQEIGTVTDNYIDGVARIDFLDKAGAVKESIKFWARLRLVAPGETGPATRSIEFSLEKRYSSLNAYTPTA